MSGRPGSNRPPSAWKADALPNELLPLYFFSISGYILHLSISTKSVGREGFEPSKVSRQIYSLFHLAALVSPLQYKFLFGQQTKNILRADGGIRTPDQLITNQLLWPTELHRLSFTIKCFEVFLRTKKHSFF